MPDTMLVSRFVSEGGKIFHRHEKNRVVTIAYASDGESILYGATIHRREHPRDAWRRKEHNYTAVTRLMDSPVQLEDRHFEHPWQREEYIRDAMHVMGCRSGRE